MANDRRAVMSLDDPVSLSVLRAAGGLLALLIAWIHLLHPRLGFGRFLLYLEVGTMYDPRPPLFVLTGVAIMVGLAAGLAGYRRRVLYAAGIVLMLVLLAGYVAWHTILEHGGFWPHLQAHAHHDHGAFEILVLHITSDRIAAVSKVAETLLLLVLLVLLGKDHGD